MVHVAAELNELAHIVVREPVHGQARRWRLLIQELGFLLCHQPGRDLLMGNLEVDAERP